MLTINFDIYYLYKNPQPPITLFKDHKGELRAQVFRPHWVQPTMTIEEQAMIEMQNMVTGGGYVKF